MNMSCSRYLEKKIQMNFDGPKMVRTGGLEMFAVLDNFGLSSEAAEPPAQPEAEA